MGPFKVGVHKRNVSHQNHFQDTILNDHYIYEIICLLNFSFFIKCLDYLNMSLNVPKDGSRTMSHCVILSKMNQYD